MKAAIFDLDGTLIDSMWVWEGLASRYLESIEIEVPDDLRESIKHFSLLQASHYLKDRFKLEDSPEEINRQAEKLLEDYYQNEFQLKPYALELLQELKARGIKMCLATATEDRLALAAIKRLGIQDYFEFLQTCNGTGLQKGDKRFFQLAIERLNEDPKDTWVFEDAYHAMESAKSTGMNVLAIEDDSAKADRQAIKEIADIYIRSFEELNVDDLFL